MSQLTAENLTVGYDGKAVLSGINFTVNRGDYLCIIGENGSGKTTLMKTILSLQAPISGKVTFGDGVASREIGYIPQQSAVQKDFPASVYEIVLSGCLNGCGWHPFYTKAQKKTVEDTMLLLNISALKKKCYRELSGGQQQRVLLARALCATKKLLLLDEPVTGLDPIVTKELYEIIEKLNKEEKITVIMISHDSAAAVRYATHILFADKVPFFGTTGEFLKSEVAAKFELNGGGKA